MTMKGALARWRIEHADRVRYAVPRREPFFELAKKYLPRDQKAIVVDIGAGDGEFARHAGLDARKEHAYLLDQNPDSVARLEKTYPHAVAYRAPERLPFDDKTVSFVHLSHIVEHLYYEDLYAFLQDLDRVLSPGGVIVFSTPLLWERFYDDMSHVKPYNPQVFINYLSSGRENASAGIISTEYSVREIVYRYRAVSGGEWGSRYFIIDLFMRFFRILLSKLGFRRYVRNGYTLVLQKSK